MRRVFADTHFYLALLNPSDKHHVEATRLAVLADLRTVTSDFVLVEVADALCSPRFRSTCIAFLDWVRSDPGTFIVPASQDLLERATALYSARPDKAWSLSGCTSFVIMEDQKINECLTADRHFIQAGFTALLSAS